MGTTPLITTNNPQNTRSTKPDQAKNWGAVVSNSLGHPVWQAASADNGLLLGHTDHAGTLAP